MTLSFSAAGDLGLDLLERPPVLPTQQPGDELGHLLHPHAAGRERARALAEQPLQRRIVHIDGVLVRHVDAHHAERILRARILAKLVARHLGRSPVDRGGIERRRLPVLHHVEMLLIEIIRIAADGWDEIVLRDDVGHAPGRIEIDLDDLGRDLRRRARRLADDDIGVEGEVAVVHAWATKSGTLTST